MSELTIKQRRSGQKKKVTIINYNTKQKTKLSPVNKRLITKEMKDKLGSSLRRCKNLLNNSQSYRKRNKTISKDTIDSYVRSTDWGKIPRKLRKKPLLSKLNIYKRLNFAKQVKKEGFCDDNRFGERLRNNIIWTDESPVMLRSAPNHQNTRIRTLDKEKSIIKMPKFTEKTMVASGITAQGVTELYILEKTKQLQEKFMKMKFYQFILMH